MLSEREEIILKIIIDETINKNEPVGSRYISKVGSLNLSPATIRNIMSDLEDLGYITQPHTSSGRIPTDKGYRYYIDEFINVEELNTNLAQAIYGLNPPLNIRDFFKEISRKVGELTRSITFIAAPKLNSMYLKHIDFVRLNDVKILAIIVTRTGMIHNVLMDIEKETSESDLLKISNYLNTNFADMALHDIKRILISELMENKTELDKIIQKNKDLGAKLFDSINIENEIIFEGTFNFLEKFEQNDMSRLKNIYKTLEEKTFIYDIVKKCFSENGIKIFIGSELGMDEMTDLGMVAKCYRRDNVIGYLGVIGPKNMCYPSVIPIVNYTADLISKFLKNYGGKDE